MATSYWEQLSDSEREVFEQIADEHAADWEEIVDGLATEQEEAVSLPALTAAVRKLVRSHARGHEFAMTWAVFRDRYPHIHCARVCRILAARAS